MRKWLQFEKKKAPQRDKIVATDPWRSADFTAGEKEILSTVEPFTMTGSERLVSLVRAIDYIVENGIEGEFVECGVWKGGSAMAMALSLKKHGITNRHLYLYDTFEGMSEPSSHDKSFEGDTAEDLLEKSEKEDAGSVWCYSALEEVKQNMDSTYYPASQIHLIKGKVEETIPAVEVPEKIALLRLDTDWYESTKHELEHLFPRLQTGGILIIDDYGHWEGCRRAVDEYIRTNNLRLFLTRVDYTCRLAVKT